MKFDIYMREFWNLLQLPEACINLVEVDIHLQLDGIAFLGLNTYVYSGLSCLI